MAARKAQKPPLMFIMDDPSHQEYTLWDIRLLKAYEIHKGMMNDHNIPYYWDRSDRVVFEVGTHTSKSRAAVERAEEKAAEGKSKNYGKSFYPIPKTRDGGPLPTLQEFLDEQSKRRAMMAGRIKVGGDFSNENWKPE